jgi:glycosyltransferase involved in cell wall biosynthesis
VGSGTHDGDVRRIAESAGLESQVELLGFRRDVPTLMSRARMLLSFSHHEGMPNVVMEAVAVGLPAVVSDIPEHRALLGAEYPFYVRLDATADEAADVISAAWTTGFDMVEHAYCFARGALEASSPNRVVAAYVDAFADIVARTDDRMTRSDQSDRGRTRS